MQSLRCSMLGLTLLVMSAAIAAAPVSAGIRDEPIVRGELGATVDDWLTRMEAFGMHGAILIEKDGAVVLAKGYGLARHDPARPITRDTSFHIGSLGKQFTAACILKLEMMGRLSVEDPITKHLDNVPDDKRAITLHQLLTHTAGLPYLPGDGSALNLELIGEPGARWRYANPGYTVLAMIVEEVSGVSLADFATKHLFHPAGMTKSTFIGDPDWPTDDVAYSYQDDNDLGPVSEDVPDARFLGAGDVATCVGDLLLWEHALRGESVLDDDAKEKFFTEAVRNEGSSVGYAYGWMTATTERGTRVVFHQGNFGGFNSDYRRYLDEEITIIFLSNHYVGGRSMRDAVVNSVSRLINGDLENVPQPPALAAGETDDESRLIEGVFALGDSERIEARIEGDALLLRGWGQRAMNVIFAPDADAEALVFAEHAGDKSVEVALAAARGDDTVLREHMSRAVMPDSSWRQLSGRLKEWSAELGALLSAESLGTALTGQPRSGRATIQIEYENGTRLLEFSWGAGGGIYQMVPVEAPPARRFLRTRAGLAAYDIFTGRTNEISLSHDESGWILRIGGECLIAGRCGAEGLKP